MPDDKILIDRRSLQLLVKPTLVKALELYQRGEASVEELQAQTREVNAAISCCPRDTYLRWGFAQPTPRHSSLDFQNTSVRQSVPVAVPLGKHQRNASERNKEPLPDNLYPKAKRSVKRIYAMLLDNPRGLTTAQLFQGTGLPIKTVQNLTAALLRRGLVKRSKIKHGGRGSRFLYVAVTP